MSKDSKTTADEKAIEEWLKENEVTVCPPCERTDPDEITYIYRAGKRGKKQ